MFEREHVLEILEDVKKGVKENDVILLKDLSNQTIHSASINQDPNSIALAVIVYSLSKIIEREKYQTYPGWNNFFNKYKDAINMAIEDVKRDDEKSFTRDLRIVRQSIEKLSGHLGKYIKDVFEKAMINKASRIYEHGISMEKTSELLGITQWELSSYAGGTGIADVNLALTKNVQQRIKNTMEILE